MAIESEGMMKSARRTSMSTGKIGALSIIGVIGGAVLFFNYLKGGQQIVTPSEHLAVQGGTEDPSLQTDQGKAKAARVKLTSRNER